MLFPHVLCDILYHDIFIHKCRLCIDECIYASGIRADYVLRYEKYYMICQN